MEFSILALIGISLAAMFFGYFFGLFEGRGQGYRRGRKEEALSRTQEPPAPTAAVPQAAATDDQQSLLVLRRDLKGQASVQIDGKQVAASNVSPALRKRLIDLMVTLRPWLEPPGAVQQDEDRIPAENPPGAPPLRSPVATPMSAVRESPAPGAADPPIAPAPLAMSLVQQIDYVLQARLAGTPLAGRGIRLAEAPHGAAIVFIGQTQFDGVDKVPDPEVQGAIRSAIAEWEKRYTPG